MKFCFGSACRCHGGGFVVYSDRGREVFGGEEEEEEEERSRAPSVEEINGPGVAEP
jgi:hypothetical protein